MALPWPGGIVVSVPRDPAKNVDVLVRIETSEHKTAAAAMRPRQHRTSLDIPFNLKPGDYHISVGEKDADSPAAEPVNYEIALTVR
jgi:hypothetical protein